VLRWVGVGLWVIVDVRVCECGEMNGWVFFENVVGWIASA
jgi:hypothetical protein